MKVPDLNKTVKSNQLGPHICLFNFISSVHELLPNGEINPKSVKRESVVFKITEKTFMDAEDTLEELIGEFKNWLKEKQNKNISE